MTGHLIEGEFQSDKYPTTPRGKVPLSVKDKSAQDLLWLYAQRRRAVDTEFSSDLELALLLAGYEPDCCITRAAFEAYIREFRRPDIGDDANELTEADFVCDLAEDGWPDYQKWLAIWCRVNAGGELTPRERLCALAYWREEDELPPAEALRLP